MITEIHLQIENVSGVQLRVLNTLKKNGLVATSHALKETPDSGKVLTLVVESDGSIDEAAIKEIVSNISGVRSASVVSPNEPEETVTAAETETSSEDEARFKNPDSEAGDVEFRDRMLVFSLLSRYPNISNRLIELKSTIPAEDRPLRLYQLGQGFGRHLVSNLKVTESILDLATALDKVVLPGLQPLATYQLRDNVISVTGYSKNLDRGNPDELLCQFILGTIEGLLKGTPGLPNFQVEKAQCLHNDAPCCDYRITAA